MTIKNGDLSVMGVPSDKYTLCASEKGKITLEGLNYETTGGGVGVYPCTNGGEIYVKNCNINTSFYNEGNVTTGNGPAVMTTATGATAENTKDVLITIEDTHMESFSDAIIFNVNGRINIKIVRQRPSGTDWSCVEVRQSWRIQCLRMTIIIMIPNQSLRGGIMRTGAPETDSRGLQ